METLTKSPIGGSTPGPPHQQIAPITSDSHNALAKEDVFLSFVQQIEHGNKQHKQLVQQAQQMEDRAMEQENSIGRLSQEMFELRSQMAHRQQLEDKTNQHLLAQTEYMNNQTRKQQEQIDQLTGEVSALRGQLAHQSAPQQPQTATSIGTDDPQHQLSSSFQSEFTLQSASFDYSDKLLPSQSDERQALQLAFATTGQKAQADMSRPKLSTTRWEEEGTFCFQVEVKGVHVARREDNHMINGTNLLNVAGMKKDRRDATLRMEKVCHVVKTGPLRLIGSWIPYDRALDLANQASITEVLYPLFVHNIGALLSHSTNQSRTEALSAPGTCSRPTTKRAPTKYRRKHIFSRMSESESESGNKTPNERITAAIKARNDLWETFREDVRKIYIDEDQTLFKTKAMVEEKYGFKSSDQYWKNRLDGWGYTKYKREEDTSDDGKTTPKLDMMDDEAEAKSDYNKSIGVKRRHDDHDNIHPRDRGSLGRILDTPKRSKPITNRRNITIPEMTPPPPELRTPPELSTPVIQQYSATPKISKILADTPDQDMDAIRVIIAGRLLNYKQKNKNGKLQTTNAEFKSFFEDSEMPEMYDATYLIHWKIKDFMVERFENPTVASFGSVIVLVGTAVCAQATTVREYLNKTHWPVTGHLLLGLIQNNLWDRELKGLKKGFSNQQTINFSATEYQNCTVTYDAYKDSVDEISVQGPEQFIVEIGQQIAWLGAALYPYGLSQIRRSRAELLVSVFPGGIIFSVSFYVDHFAQNEKSCWHNLFLNSVIVHGFPIPSRGEEIGLEIPIQMMAALGGASQAIEYEGGLVMKGFSSMLVPLSRSSSGKSIQWHFIFNEDEDRLEYSQADIQSPGRALLDTVDHASLTSTRAFLGWWGKAATRLGAADVNYHNIDWSATKEPDRAATFSGGTVGFQNMAVGQLNFNVAPKDHRFHISRSGSYQNIIKYASRTPVVLYDTEEKRGWLVPSSAVIAHIVQTRNFDEPFAIDGKPVDITPTDPTHNVYEAAKSMLLANGPTTVQVDEDGGSIVYFRDVVLGIWTILEFIMERDIKKRSTADPTIQVTTRKRIQGWEFMDIVYESSPLVQKETVIEKTCGDWPNLIQDIDAIVLFASGFEDLIMPHGSPQNGLCHAWRTVPKNKDYLAASVAMLNSLYEKSGSRLTRKHLSSTHLQWHRGQNLFEGCENAGAFACKCDRLQRIVHESSLSFGTVTPPGLLEEEGAVIFGQATHSLRTPVSKRANNTNDFMYRQGRNLPLVLEEGLQCSPGPDISDNWESSSQIALESGETFMTSAPTKNEDIQEHYVDDRTEQEATSRSLKRPREEFQCLTSGAGAARRNRPRLDEPNIDIGFGLPEASSPTLLILADTILTHEHRLRRKAPFTFEENEDVTRRQLCVEDLEKLPVRSQMQQKTR